MRLAHIVSRDCLLRPLPRLACVADKDCCAKGGYKVEGRGVVCKEVGPKVKAKRELR